MKKLVLLILIFVLNYIEAQQKITVWPKGQMPNSKGLKLKTVEEKEGRITQIQDPELFAFLPAKEERKQMAIIIIPGGGYHHLTYDLGGYSYAKWLNTLGISAFVLNYRLPTSPDLKQERLDLYKTFRLRLNIFGKMRRNGEFLQIKLVFWELLPAVILQRWRVILLILLS